MTQRVKIYRPAKNAMQSGRGRTKEWVMEYDDLTARRPEPLMGWTASGDTLNQVRLFFDTAEEAVKFAQKEGFAYTLAPDQARRVRPRNYVDNFRYQPPEETGRV